MCLTVVVYDVGAGLSEDVVKVVDMLTNEHTVVCMHQSFPGGLWMGFPLLDANHNEKLGFGGLSLGAFWRRSEVVPL